MGIASSFTPTTAPTAGEQENGERDLHERPDSEDDAGLRRSEAAERGRNERYPEKAHVAVVRLDDGDPTLGGVRPVPAEAETQCGHREEDGCDSEEESPREHLRERLPDGGGEDEGGKRDVERERRQRPDVRV